MKYHQTPSFFVNQQQQNEGGATTHRLVLGRPTTNNQPEPSPESTVRQEETPARNTIVVVQIEKEAPNPTTSIRCKQQNDKEEALEGGSSMKRVVAPASHSKPPYLWDPRASPSLPPRPVNSGPCASGTETITKQKAEKIFDERTTEKRELRSERKSEMKLLPSTSGREDEGRGTKASTSLWPAQTLDRNPSCQERAETKQSKVIFSNPLVVGSETVENLSRNAHAHGVTMTSPLLWGSAGLSGLHNRGSKSPSPTSTQGVEESQGGGVRPRQISKSPSPIEELFWRATAVSTRWNWDDLWTTFNEAPDLTTMTEDLWSHALKFLDKYRSNADKYDIEELYEFADHTGILERHRQLLAKPFHENQVYINDHDFGAIVDMKIMYYELIKMLIEYERNKQPEVWDASKSVGKIEGYQELTNKLQRYLNQRFMLDGDQVKEQQETIATVAGKTESTLERCARLEAMIESLSTSYSKLATQYNKVEQANQEILSRLEGDHIQKAEKDKVSNIRHAAGGVLVRGAPEAVMPTKESKNLDLLARIEALESQQVQLLSQSQRSSEESREAQRILAAKVEQQEKDRRQIEDLMAEEVEFTKEKIKVVEGKVEEMNDDMNSLKQFVGEGRHVTENVISSADLVQEQGGEIEAIKSRLSSLELDSRDQSGMDKVKGRLTQLEAANVKQTSLESARNKVVRDNMNEIEAINSKLSSLAETPQTIASLCSKVTFLEDVVRQQGEASEVKANDDNQSMVELRALKDQVEQVQIKAEEVDSVKKRISSLDGRLANAELTGQRLVDLDLVSKRVAALENTQEAEITRTSILEEALTRKVELAISNGRGADDRISTLSAKIAEIDGEKTEMKEALRNREGKTAEVHQGLNGRLESLEKSVKRNIAEIDQNKVSLDRNTEDISNLKHLHKSITNELTGLEKMTKEKWTRVEAAQSSMKENQADVATLRTNVANLQNTLNEVMPASRRNEEEIRRLENLLHEMQEVETSRATYLEAAVTACQKELDGNKGEVEKILKSLEDNQKMSTKIKDLDVKCESLSLMSRENFDKLENFEKSGADKLKLFEDSLNSLKPATDKNSSLLETLRQKVDNEEEARKVLENQVHQSLRPSFERTTADLEKLQHEVERMSNDKANLEKSIARSSEVVESKITKIVDDLNVGQLVQCISDLDEKFSKSTDENQQKLQQLTRLEDQSDRHKTRLEKLEQSFASQEKVVVSEDASRKIRETETAVLESQNKKLLENVMTEIKSVQKALEDTINEERAEKLIGAAVEALSMRVKATQAQLDKSEEERNKLDRKVSETSEQFVEMVENNSTELTAVKADMKDLKKGMEKSQNDINETKENTEKRLVQMSRQSIAESEGQISRLQDSIEVVDGKCDELKGTVMRINHNLEESSHKWVDLEREVREATKRLPAENEKVIDQLQKTVAQLERQALQNYSEVCDKEIENKESLEKVQRDLADLQRLVLERKPDSETESWKEPLKHLETQIISLLEHSVGVDKSLKSLHEEEERVKTAEKDLRALADKIDQLRSVNAAEMSDVVTNMANLEANCEQMSSAVNRSNEQLAELHKQFERERAETEELQESVLSKIVATDPREDDFDQQLESMREELANLSNDSHANRLAMSQVLAQGDKHKDTMNEISKLRELVDNRSKGLAEMSERISVQDARLAAAEEGLVGQDGSLETLAALPEYLEKLKGDLRETRLEVADLRDLKGQIVSLTKPVENMEITMKHLGEAFETLEEEVREAQSEKDEMRGDFNNQLELLRGNITDGKSVQAEVLKTMESFQHDNNLEKLKQDLAETQREVADLGGLKTQIVSLAKPLEKMEATLKDLSGVVELVEEEVGKGKKERLNLEEKIQRDTDSVRKEMEKLRIDLTATTNPASKEGTKEDFPGDTSSQLNALKEEQKTILSKVAEGEKEVIAIRADQEGLLEKLVFGEKEMLQQLEMLKKEQDKLHNLVEEAEKAGKRELEQLAGGTEAALQEVRHLVDQKAELQSIEEKVELLEKQKLNTDTLHSVAQQLATNTGLIRGLIDWREKLEENESRLEHLEREVKDQAAIVRGVQVQVEVEKSRSLVGDDPVAVPAVSYEVRAEELSLKVEQLANETQTNVSHLLSELGNLQKLGDKVKLVERENSTLQEKISHLAIQAEANKEEVLSKVAALEKDSAVNKSDKEVITGHLEVHEIVQRADAVQTSGPTNEVGSHTRIAELDEKVALLERQWSEYSTNTMLESKIEELRKDNFGAFDKIKKDMGKLQQSKAHIEELRNSDKVNKTAIEKCSSDVNLLTIKIEDLVQSLHTVQEQVKNSDKENAADLKSQVDETQGYMDKHAERISSLESSLSRQEERQNEAALRTTMLTSNVNEKLTQHEKETETRITEVEKLAEEFSNSASKTKAEVECLDARLKTIEGVMHENKVEISGNVNLDKLDRLESCYQECAAKLNLLENRIPSESGALGVSEEKVQAVESKLTDDPVPVVVTERLQGASSEDLNATVRELQFEVATLKETILKTELNMGRILEQTSVVLLRDASQEERVALVEQQQKELEAADVFLQEANRQLMEKVVALESRLRKVEERVRQEREGESLDALVQMDEDLQQVRGRLQALEETQVGGGEVKHITSVEIAPELESRVERLETFKVETEGKIDVLLQANEDIANTFISIKDDFKQTQSLTQKIQKMNIGGIHTVDGRDLNVLDSMERSIMTLTEQSNKVMEDVVRQEEEVREIRKDMKTDQNLIIIRFNTHKDAVDKLIQKVEEKVSFLENSQREELVQLASLERKASEYEDIYSRLEVRQANEEAGPLLEKGEEMKTHRFDLVAEVARLLGELCMALRGSTVVLKSEGGVAENQGDVLGVYRMVDTYSDRPVYKQDGGENYIYYSSASSSWLVGTVVGHEHAWLRNTSEEAPSTRWVPDLQAGWEYRPLVRSSFDPLTNSSTSQDGTFRIEALSEVERVSNMIKKLQTERV